MKKILCAVMTLVMLAAMLTACGSTSGNEKPANETPGNEKPANETSGNEKPANETPGNETVSYDPVKISENYTFEDPTDIDFDKRYVITCDESSPMVAAAASYGMSAAYTILYAKEDAPVAQYDFMVVDTEEHAQGVIDLYASQGTALKALDEDATVLWASSDGDAVEGSIVAMQSAGMISETTVSAYVEFYSQTIGGKVQ